MQERPGSQWIAKGLGWVVTACSLAIVIGCGRARETLPPAHGEDAMPDATHSPPLPESAETEKKSVSASAGLNPEIVTTPGRYGTGVGLVDLDGDDLLDLVVANGNDMAAQPITVHRHTGDPEAPYDSAPETNGPADTGYHGDVCLGDVDDDGDIDVGVAYAFDNDLDLAKGGVRFFVNDGGKLTLSTTWTVNGFAPFACDLGDVDRDGRLDLGVAVLWDHGGKWELPKTPLKIALARDRAALRIYRNAGTGFETKPWKSDSVDGFVALAFEDVDRDGDLDLASAGRRVEVRFGDGKAIAKRPAVQSRERFLFPYGLAVADTGLGSDTIIVNSGCRLPPCVGRYMAWTTEPRRRARRGSAWSSGLIYFPAPLTVADVLADPGAELLGGSWGSDQNGGRLLVYRADGTTFEPDPCLYSIGDSVSQYKVVRSIRPGPTDTRTDSTKASSRGHVLRLPAIPLRVTGVRVDGNPHDDWAWSPEHAWVSVGDVKRDHEIEVDWISREARDLVVADWLVEQGDLVFLHDADFACNSALREAPIAATKDLIPDEGDWTKVAKQLEPLLETHDGGPARFSFRAGERREAP